MSTMDMNNENVYATAATAGYAYTLISNNFKHIHLNAIGPRFDRIHSLCDDYYRYFSDKADFFFELALQYFDSVDNPSYANGHASVSILPESNYDYQAACAAMISMFQSAIEYITALRDVAVEHSDIQSDCDSELSYLNKELNFFMRKRLDENVEGVSPC